MDKYHDTPVAMFHRVFGHPIATTPTVPPVERRALRLKLMAEELCEFAEAAGLSLRIEAGHFIKVAACGDQPVNLVECADGLGDLRYLVDGTNLEFGFPGHAVLMEIHKSNMTKLGADGKPVRREDGKTLKGPNYRPPNIARVLRVAGLRDELRIAQERARDLESQFLQLNFDEEIIPCK